MKSVIKNITLFEGIQMGRNFLNLNFLFSEFKCKNTEVRPKLKDFVFALKNWLNLWTGFNRCGGGIPLSPRI